MAIRRFLVKKVWHLRRYLVIVLGSTTSVTLPPNNIAEAELRDLLCTSMSAKDCEEWIDDLNLKGEKVYEDAPGSS